MSLSFSHYRSQSMLVLTRSRSPLYSVSFLCFFRWLSVSLSSSMCLCHWSRSSSISLSLSLQPAFTFISHFICLFRKTLLAPFHFISACRSSMQTRGSTRSKTASNWKGETEIGNNNSNNNNSNSNKQTGEKKKKEKKGPERFMFGLFKSAKLPDLVGRPFGRKREFPFEHLGFEEDKFEKVWNCHFRPTEKNNQPHESKKDPK